MMEQKELERRLNYLRDREDNYNKGIIDAIIDVGRCLESMYGDDNTGNMEAVNDYIDDIIGSPETSIPKEYADKYLYDDGRCNAYVHTMTILRSLANLRGW